MAISIDILKAQLAKLMEQLRIMTTLQPIMKRKGDMVIAEMKRRGFDVKITQGYRSKAEQDKLYAQGRTTPGKIVTNAKGGQSFHNYGVAIDFAFIVDGKFSWASSLPWGMLGDVGEKYGMEWGGRWKSFPDLPHFQYTDKYVLADFQAGIVDYNLFK